MRELQGVCENNSYNFTIKIKHLKDYIFFECKIKIKKKSEIYLIYLHVM